MDCREVGGAYARRVRPRRSRLALAVLTLASPLACRRGEAVRRDDVATTPAPKDLTACPVPADGHVAKSLTLPAGCKAAIAGAGLFVDAGGALLIEAGVELSFAPEGQLVVRGGELRAVGTEAATIVLRAASKRWMGVVLEKGALAKGSRLERVEVRDVGAEAGAPAVPKAAIEVQSGAEGTTLANVRVRHCEPTSLRVETATGLPSAPGTPGTSGLASAEGLDFEAPEVAGKPSIELSAQALGSVVSAHVAAPVRLTAPLVTGPTTWPKLDAPIEAPTGLMLAGNGTGPATTLRLAEGTTLLVGRGHRVYVGDVGRGTLIAHKVRFDSAEAKPAAGDWPGLDLRDAFGSELVDCTVAHAGTKASPALPGGAGATATMPEAIVVVRFHSAPKIERTKFVDDVGWAIASYDGCGSATAAASGNDFGGLSPCWDGKARLAAELGNLDIQMLGALGKERATPTTTSKGAGGDLWELGGPADTWPPSGGLIGGSDLRRGGTASPRPPPQTPPSTTP